MKRTVGVASAIFAVGAGLGWNFASLLFGREAPSPMVAAVRFEDSRPDGIPSTQRYEAALPTSPTSTQAEDRRSYQPDMAVRPSDEERRLAEALQWAERYRQRQDASVHGVIARQVQDEKVRLAAAEAQRWAEVAEEANRVKQPQVEIRQLIATQGQQQHGPRRVAEGSRIASAAGSIGGAHVEPATTRARMVRCEDCGRRPSRKQARATRSPRVATRHVRTHRTRSDMAIFMCPFRWLEAAIMGERRSGRRYARRHTVVG